MAAVAERLGEQRSLDALAGSLRAKLQVEPKVEETASPGVLTCERCRAPLAPGVDATATCPFCGQGTAVPEELQQRARAQVTIAQSRAATEQLVESLLEQPGAARASAALLATTVGVVGAWAAALVPLFVAGVGDAGVFEVGLSLAAGALGSIAVVSLGKVGLVNRAALRLLTSSFGARAPIDPRGAPGCRACHAPLPRADRTVVGCAYCGAENILGVDLRPRVAPAKEHQLSLEQVFASRRRQRSRALAAAVVTLSAGGLSGFGVLMSAVTSSEFAERKRACEGGDARACTAVARTYSTGSVVAKDEVKAAAFDERACALDDGEGCFDLSLSYRRGSGVEQDSARERTLRAKACQLGYAEACAPAD